MKCVLAAFLLLLYDGSVLQAAGREMCRQICHSVKFNKEKYNKYSAVHIKESEAYFIWQCFRILKENAGIEEEARQKYIKWAEGLVRTHTLEIIRGKMRKYYGDCAAYIAMIGEVHESWGEAGAKQRILTEYKMLYPHGYTFHSELRAYGMEK